MQSKVQSSPESSPCFPTARWTHVSDECNRLKIAFWRLKFPKSPHQKFRWLKDLWPAATFITSYKDTDDTVQVVLPFKDQISADIVKEQLKDLSLKVNTTTQPVFASRKIEQELNATDRKWTVCSLKLLMWPVWCRLCRLHTRIFTQSCKRT